MFSNLRSSMKRKLDDCQDTAESIAPRPIKVSAFALLPLRRVKPNETLVAAPEGYQKH